MERRRKKRDTRGVAEMERVETVVVTVISRYEREAAIPHPRRFPLRSNKKIIETSGACLYKPRVMWASRA